MNQSVKVKVTGRQNSKVQTSSCTSNFEVFAFLILEFGSGRIMQCTIKGCIFRRGLSKMKSSVQKIISCKFGR